MFLWLLLQSMPCGTVVDKKDCSGSSCDPSCDFALFTPPSKCSNPYSSEHSCGMGLGAGAALGIEGEEGTDAAPAWEGTAEEGLLQGETGTCLEMIEVTTHTGRGSQRLFTHAHTHTHITSHTHTHTVTHTYAHTHTRSHTHGHTL